MINFSMASLHFQIIKLRNHEFFFSEIRMRCEEEVGKMLKLKKKVKQKQKFEENCLNLI